MRRLPFFALMTANVISLFGNQFTAVALPWFVLQTTGSATKTGLTGFSVGLPYFLVGIFGGALVDRVGFRNTSVLADIVSGLAIASIPLLHHTIGLVFWQFLALVFVASMLGLPGLSARRSMLPEIATLSGLRLERMNALFEAIQPTSLLLGPVIAGVLIVWLGASNVLWIDAATFAVSATLVRIGVPAISFVAHNRKRDRYVDALREGLRFLRNDHLLLTMAIWLAVSNFLMGPLFGVILPVYAKREFGRAADLGLMLAAFGAGQLIGIISYGVIGHRFSRRVTWLIAFVGETIPFWVLLWKPALPIILVTFALVALVDGPANPLLVTVRHERTPAELRGRVFSTFSALSTVAIPLGMVTVGAVISAIGLKATLLALALLSQIIGFAPIFMPVFRELDTEPAALPVPE